jgi:large subunit ribosomal protein L5
MPRVQQGGILDIAQPMPISKVMLVCPAATSRRASRTRPGQRSQRPRLPHCGEQLEVKVVTSAARALPHEVVPALQKQFGYANPMQVPRLDEDRRQHRPRRGPHERQGARCRGGRPDHDHRPEADRHPAKRSIAQFRLRTGNPIGAKVTLRGERMWDFLERLTRLALPRIRDFRGVPGKSFDGRGNYSLGLREQLAFPEIDYDKVDRLRGLEISIVTTAKTDEESKRLLELLGMPFAG